MLKFAVNGKLHPPRIVFLFFNCSFLIIFGCNFATLSQDLSLPQENILLHGNIEAFGNATILMLVFFSRYDKKLSLSRIE